MNLSNIKVIFIDIDGTLVTDQKEVTLSTKNSIKRVVDKGILVVLVSGRDLLHTIDKSELANASSLVVATNGGEIYDYKKDVLVFADYFDFSKIIKAWEYCNEHELPILLKSFDGVYLNKYASGRKGIGFKVIDDLSNFNSNVSQFLIVSDKKDKLDDACALVNDMGLAITSYSSSYMENSISSYYSIDVNNNRVSKGTAVSKVLNYLNIEKEDSLCFGDYLNDIDMFKACGVKVAMGNAIDSLKEKADFITKSNNEDGIAYFLDKYL